MAQSCNSFLSVVQLIGTALTKLECNVTVSILRARMEAGRQTNMIDSQQAQRQIKLMSGGHIGKTKDFQRKASLLKSLDKM